MFASKLKKVWCILFFGLLLYTASYLLQKKKVIKDCPTGLGILEATKKNFESMAWLKLEKHESLHSVYAYSAEPAKPKKSSGKRTRHNMRKSITNTTICPFYPYADGGRVAKWDCGYGEAKEILSSVPALNGCPINLDTRLLMSQFVRKLHSKTLWILGESISVEIFIALSCGLRVKTDLKFHAVGEEELEKVKDNKLKNHWKTLRTRADMRGIHCVLIKEEPWNMRVCLCRIHKAPFEFGLFNTMGEIERGFMHLEDFSSIMDPADILLFGFGIAVNSQDVEPGKISYGRQVALFFQWYNKRRDVLPQLIWRETPAQHFSTKNGFYDSSHSNRKCENWSFADTFVNSESNWRNTIANSVALKFHVPVLKIWSLSAARGDAHVGTDCTHFCLPGIPDIWALLLMETVRDLT